MPELGGSALEHLAHTSRVEEAFLELMVNGRFLMADDKRDYPEIRETFQHVAEGYRREIPAVSSRLADSVHVPWFQRAFTVEQVLLQVATHSVQHRAGVCAGVARAGQHAPDLDYITWLNTHR